MPGVGDIHVQCPACQGPAWAPAVMAGRVICCPGCRAQMTLPGGVPQVPAAVPIGVGSAGAGPGIRRRCPECSALVPQGSGLCPDCGVSMTEARSRKRERVDLEADRFSDRIGRRGRGSFAVEKRALDSGMLGGIGIMVVSAVWFVGGLAMGYLFFYPPILFALGLSAFVMGLGNKVTGGGGGGRGRRRRGRRRR